MVSNGESIDQAISLVRSLIDKGVLVEREPRLNYKLDFAGGLEELDKRLQNVKRDPPRASITTFTSGSAGASTKYGAMLKQSVKCFCAFLPMIEHYLQNKNGDKSAIALDELRARALSYACVSHGLDPAHLIALRYAMNNDDTNWGEVKKLNKELAESLFRENADMPLTTELMRTRILGAVVRFDATLKTLSEEDQTRFLRNRDYKYTESFGRSYLSQKRSSMFI